MTLINNAIGFALHHHGDQLYGDKPYVESHLADVARIVEFYGGTDEDIAAAWLHDVVEDTAATFEEVYARFGWHVGGIVGACTGFGDTREKRNQCIYDRIALRKHAALVKTADRIANVEACKKGSHHAVVYLREQVEFFDNVARFAPTAMQERLVRAYEALS